MFLFLHPRNRDIARSSNGRTSDFGSDCVGSNPARATSQTLIRFRKERILFLKVALELVRSGTLKTKSVACFSHA